MLQLSSVEHKFLIQLHQQDNHCLPLDQIHPNPKTPRAQCRSAARHLQQLALVDYDESIQSIGITSKGRIVFEVEMAARPVTPDELLILKSCRYHRISPSEITRKVPESMRRSLIDALENRRMITTKRSIANVWLTAAGLSYCLTPSPDACKAARPQK